MRQMKEDGISVMDKDGEVQFFLGESFLDGIMTLQLKGSVNLYVYYEFEDELMAVLSVCDKIILDFSETEHISSDGLKMLLQMQQIIDQRKNAFLLLKHLNGEVLETFQETGFWDLFEIEEETECV